MFFFPAICFPTFAFFNPPLHQKQPRSPQNSSSASQQCCSYAGAWAELNLLSARCFDFPPAVMALSKTFLARIALTWACCITPSWKTEWCKGNRNASCHCGTVSHCLELENWGVLVLCNYSAPHHKGEMVTWGGWNVLTSRMLPTSPLTCLLFCSMLSNGSFCGILVHCLSAAGLVSVFVSATFFVQKQVWSEKLWVNKVVYFCSLTWLPC